MPLRFKIIKRKKWSNKWKSSKDPSKQRKYRFNAPLHIKKNFLHVHLSKELRKKYNKRAITPRKGDKVKILRGEHKGKVGEIERISIKDVKIYLKNFKMKKKDGTEIPIPFEPSKLMITEINTEHKDRFKELKGSEKNQEEQEKE
ncbi:MAG: 50S ribosomal protein L24 [Candidatus Woesearchaeota archaeon]